MLSGQAVSKGVTLDILTGGTASGTIVSSGGIELVSAGGADIGAQLSRGAVLKVLSGGVATNDAISSGGSEIVGSGGLGVLNSGGILSSGGPANAVTVRHF